ncbi:MAG: pyruvate/2-oxoglutarate dehydrogenase complex dihydrolipoamide dehydrogenase (E3) component [Verrucomicrobiales bacterium]|jgi:pyruvate/2-oxoglutarate dehydrogenase complex dihydrolipoamide dehydrogenase (E3) component
MATRFVVIGGGPAGLAAATHAARLGADVTLIERDIIGGAAHLWDCVPSKAMIATGGALSFLHRSEGMGLETVTPHIDTSNLSERLAKITDHLERSNNELLNSQNVRIMGGTGRLVGTNEIEVTLNDGSTESLEADKILLSTGSRPRIPEWCTPDGERILTTRDAYPPPEIPEHLTVIGSGVTGVEFVHMFSSLGSKVTLIVSRQHVLPDKDPEVAYELEQNFIKRDVKLLKGARSTSIERNDDHVVVKCDDGRMVESSHALLAIGSIPNSDSLNLEAAGVDSELGFIAIDENSQSNVSNIYAAGDLSGKLPLSSVATMQGRKIAEHAMGMHNDRKHRHINYSKAASAIFTEPEIADVGVSQADAFAHGRKVRVTKVPFSASAKALINDDPRGFVKLISDPATGVVLGGSIVGRHAAELISIIALCVQNQLTVIDLAETLFVHPTLSETLIDAAE